MTSHHPLDLPIDNPTRAGADDESQPAHASPGTPTDVMIRLGIWAVVGYWALRAIGVLG